MKRKVLAVLLTVTLSMSLAACGKSTSIDDNFAAADDAQQRIDREIDSSNSDSDSDNVLARANTDSSDEEQEQISEDTEVPEAAEADLSDMWTESTTWTDDDGYTYKFTVTGTPWMPWDSEDLKNIWGVIGKGNPMPMSFDDWGIERYQSGNIISYKAPYSTSDNGFDGFLVEGEMTDFYYTVGTLKIENITEGWDITPENTRSATFAFCPNGTVATNRGKMTKFIGRIFYSDPKTKKQLLYIDAKMKSNTWGEIPFIMAHAENKSPKYPDGRVFR